ncbi:TPA: hypothetical protein DIS60_00730 [Patescibacteria group bacterium]|nr:hypothetical protein [Patescibacteria group bacterium]
MTKREKIKYKQQLDENREIRLCVHLRCADCCGLFKDSYIKCTSPICPLFPYFPTKGQMMRKVFVQRLKDLDKSLGN